MRIASWPLAFIVSRISRDSHADCRRGAAKASASVAATKAPRSRPSVRLLSPAARKTDTRTIGPTSPTAPAASAIVPKGVPVRPASRMIGTDLTGPYLPVIGWPSRLSAAGGAAGQFGFDASSGVVVSTAPGVQGLGYDVAGEVPRDDGHQEASPSTTPERASARALPAWSARTLCAKQPTSSTGNRSPDRRSDNRLSSLETESPAPAA